MKSNIQYNLPEIRKLINAVFDDTGVDALCLDYFSTVYDQFGRGQGKREKITQLLNYCRAAPIQRFEKLLSIIQASDEQIFQQFEPFLREQRHPPLPPPEVVSQTELKSLVVSLREWKLIHNDLQEALNMFRVTFDGLTSYRFKADPDFLEQSFFTWKELYAAKLKSIPSQWNLQHVNHPTLSELQAKCLEIDEMSEELIKESCQVKFPSLYLQFRELRAILWNILLIADKQIMILVEKIALKIGA